MTVKRLGQARVLHRKLEELRARLANELLNAPYDGTAPAAQITVNELKLIMTAIDWTKEEVEHLTVQNRRLDGYDGK